MNRIAELDNLIRKGRGDEERTVSPRSPSRLRREAQWLREHGMIISPVQRELPPMPIVKQSDPYRRACFVCASLGRCEHREPLVEAAWSAMHHRLRT